jgi:CRISPR-associated endonuclease/helicase Cas3
MDEYKARYRTHSDTDYQTLTDHLNETGMLAELFAKPCGLERLGLLIGLLHDLGKNSQAWQEYLEKNKESGKAGDKRDHAAAGGQFLYGTLIQKDGDDKEMIGELLAACIMYHHGSGLPDVITPDGMAKLYSRLTKDIGETCLDESLKNLNPAIRQRVNGILSCENFIAETMETLKRLIRIMPIRANRSFNLGLTARLLSSCLIDADRTSSAYYDRGIPVVAGDNKVKADWHYLLGLLETHLDKFPKEGKINEIRGYISARCADFAGQESGIHTLTAATGAGKTLAALKYALVHAKKYKKERIFIIAPYTSILDQNADAIRDILDPDGENGRLILEHHSNLDQSEVTEHFIDSSQSWNVPIIITTMVQFLEALFGSGTRKIRRMHQLTDSVIVFDEVQTLPVSCTYLFTWALQYLCRSCNSSALLCTATQPGFDRIKLKKYALPLTASDEVVPNLREHFEDLKRVELLDKTKPIGWTLDEVADFIEQLPERSILTVVNTKPQAQKLYADLSKKHPDWKIFHLSTNMCPAHRRKIIGNNKIPGELKESLKDKTNKCICISTKLIEAGVDLDFDAAIRFLAGLDSVIQTSGRCNRNGNLKDINGNPIIGKTYIINIIKEEENIKSLKELMLGQDVMRRILREYHDAETQFNHTLLHPDLIAGYFNYFYGLLDDSLLKHKVFTGRDDTVLDLLSDNEESLCAYNRMKKGKPENNMPDITGLCQSFETAWKHFEVIASDTVGVLVHFEKGHDIINKLYSFPDPKQVEDLLREGQQYSVNIYSGEIQRLIDRKIVRKIQTNNQMVIYAFEEGYYNEHTGISHEYSGMNLLQA